MEKYFLLRFSGVLMAWVCILLTSGAKANEGFPFEMTPEGYTNYLNNYSSANWRSGGRYTFYNPRECSLGHGVYSCDFDYTEETALGSRICINATVYHNKSRANKYLPKECGDWEKVTLAPQPVKQSTPAPLPGQGVVGSATRTEVFSISKRQFIATSIFFFVLGCAIGLIIGIGGNKKG